MVKTTTVPWGRFFLSLLPALLRGEANVDTQEQVRALCIYRKWQRKLNALRREGIRLRRRIDECARGGHSDELSRVAEKLTQVTRDARALASLGTPEDGTRQRFVFSSAMLRESFRYCVSRPEEGMHFILGIEHEGMLIGTHIVPFPYEYRSVAGAAGVHQATHKICIQAHETGHYAIALVHSHPGSGIDANHPSPTDRRTQTLWECGTRLLGGIWSRDGYLRWYTNELAFAVNVEGNQIERVEENVWKIETEDLEVYIA